jgi:hypothetical protein
MGTTQYDIVSKGDGWAVQHDGRIGMAYSTKEAAFEAAATDASLAIRDGHEVIVRIPGGEARNKDKADLGVKNNQTA